MRRAMSTARYGCIVCLLVILVQWPGPIAAQNATLQAGAALPHDDGSCPLTSENFANTDFASVRTACDIDTMTDGAFCKSCVCGLGTAIVLGFEKAGIKIHGQDVTTLAAAGDVDALNALLNNCSAIMGIELLQAGALTAQALGQLASCNVNQSTLDCAGPAGSPGSPTGNPSSAASAPQAEASNQAPAAAPAPAPAKSASGATDVSVVGVLAALMVYLAAVL